MQTLQEPVMVINEIENSVIRGVTIGGIIARSIVAGSTKARPRCNTVMSLVVELVELRMK